MNQDPLNKAVIKSIQNNCIEIKTTEPCDDFSDLEQLKPILADVDIIGLGEATHGTHEFFAFKHRLLRFLVREMGFTVLAFETPYTGQVNAYIKEGKVDPAFALRGQSFLVWQTEEILEMIRWMHDYNRREQASPKIEFIGIDCQMDKRLVKESIDVLKSHSLHHATITRVDQLFDEFLEYMRPNTTKIVRRELQSIGCSLIGQLAFLQSVFAATGQHISSEVVRDNTDEITDHLTILSQAVQLYMVLNNKLKAHNLRDRCMADNVSRIVERGAKVALWAHNGHISCRKSNYREDMGSHLRRTFGNRYYALALTFFKGSFRIFESRTESQEFSIAMPPSENVEHLFQQSGIQRFFLDLRELKKDQSIDRWWSLPHKAQGIGPASILRTAL